jgi:HEAT repeat protein
VNVVTALGEQAKVGSAKAVRAVVGALEDLSPAVRTRAALIVGQFKPPEALPGLLIGIEARQPALRLSFVRALGQYGAAAHGYAAQLRARLTLEADPVVRTELERVLRTMPQ